MHGEFIQCILKYIMNHNTLYMKCKKQFSHAMSIVNHNNIVHQDY